MNFNLRSIALWTWALPGTAIGLVLALLGGMLKARGEGGGLGFCVSRLFPNWASAQTWGAIVLYRVGTRSYSSLETAAHEDRHRTQWAVFGPLFLVAYPLASFVAWLQDGDYYYDNWFEKDAREHEQPDRRNQLA